MFLAAPATFAQEDIDDPTTTTQVEDGEDSAEDDEFLNDDSDSASDSEEAGTGMPFLVLLLIIVTIILMLHGMPLFGALGGLGLLLTYDADGWEGMLNNFVHPFSSLSENELLLPIPLFTLVGYVLANSQAPKRIVAVFQWLTQKTLGASAATFGILALIVAAVFTPLTGASGVTIIALGGILFPILAKQKYDEQLNLGIITSSGSLGLLFFPSLPVILYGILSNNKAPIPDLFIAGLIPGALLIIIPSIWIIIKTRKIKTDAEKLEFSTDVKPHLVKFLIEMAAIPVLFYLFLTGKIIIAEMGMLTLVYYFVLEVIIYREIKAAKLFRVFEESMSLLGGILIIIFFAMAFTGFLVDQQVPDKIFDALSPYIKNKWTFLILLNIFLLLVGALMDIFSAIVVVAPLIIPLGEKYGINMVHLGILFLTNLEIGYLTPPVGINLFISSFRFKKPLVEIYKSVIPFLIALLITQIIITYIPFVSLWYELFR